MAAVIKLLAILLSLSLFLSFTLASDDVDWWCSKTPYPKLCKENSKSDSLGSISTYTKRKSNFRNTAIKSTIEKAVSAQSHNKKLGKKCRNKKEHAAWTDCLELYEAAIKQLNSTVDPNTKCSDVDAQTWLSTALTNLETCREGFLELGVSDFVLPQMNNNVSKLISNTLAINNISSSEEESYKEEFPTWLSKGDRKLLQSSSTKANIVVAQDGSGNYKTVKAAVDAASKMTRSGRFIIYIKAGTYKENIEIGSSLKNIMLLGDGMRYTIITGSRSVGGGSTTFLSGTVLVTGGGFMAKGITFRNTAGPENGQAVALRGGSDLSVFYRCGFEGYQDTLYVHSQRQFYKECYIYGTVDFIFGNAAVVFQNCMIYGRKGKSGQQVVVTAQGRSDKNQNTGISIQGSRVMAASDLVPVLSQHKTYLGRPWREYSRTVFMQSYLDTLVQPAGWLAWDGDFALKTLYYGEYKNKGPGSPTDKRVKWGGYHVITSSSEASQFTVANFIAGRSWLPDTGVPFTAGL